jgi:transcriptional regulator with XRE-family HTH domain
MKLSDLRTAAEVHEEDMNDPEYRAEYEDTTLANAVALRVTAYRAEHGMTQAELARTLGMQQPNIARLEAGEREPSLSTLARLSSVLRIDFSIDIKDGIPKLRKPRRPAAARKKSARIVQAALGFESKLQRNTVSSAPTRSSMAPAAHHKHDVS